MGSPFSIALGPSTVTNGTQNLAGAKTWVIPHFDGTAETVAVWRLDEDTSSSVVLGNATGTNAQFQPRFTFTQSGANRACSIVAQGTDSGAVSYFGFTARASSSTAAATRPLCDFINLSTTVMSLSAAGALSISGGTAPGLTMGGPIQLKSYTVATLPASPTAGKIAYVSDAAGNGPCIAMGNGSVWKRCDNTSTTVA